ncbi:hypothetical protein GCM10008967_18510 [Bacillus carboniphilus]|uniref:Uncharacterized protein n=1 Tax=Bacillus carboniphilus TaxID=86663 RepID=A0ABP3FYY9_9BACI
MGNSLHPTIKKCLQHLDVLGADDKIKQIVYMYMEGLKKDLVQHSSKEGKDSKDT